jgi:hypothetical protein
MSDSKTSRQNLKVLLAVGEEITSISDILVNGVSIADREIAFAYTKGTPSQPHITGFEKVSVEATGEILLGTGTMSYTYQVPNNINGDLSKNVDVGFSFPDGLYQVFNSGNTGGNTVRFRFECGLQGEAFPTPPVGETYLEYNVGLKSLTPAKALFHIARPDTLTPDLPWQIRVTRLTAVGNLPGTEKPSFISTSTVNFSTWAATPLQTYAGTALLSIWVEDVSLINGSWPEITVKTKGMQMYCPAETHYNAEAKTYDDSVGHAWDGAFSRKVFTNNLSYVIYSLLSDKLTKTIPINPSGTDTLPLQVSFGIPEEGLGIYSFYNFARYCDETYLGVPRYTINKQFIDKMGRREFLNSLLAIGNAKLVRKHGLLCITWDRLLSTEELAATTLLVPENTTEGFSYSRSHLSERYTQVSVLFEDGEHDNVVSSVQADSIDLIKYLKNPAVGLLPSNTANDYYIKNVGYNATSVQLIGAVSYQTALIKARSLLFDVLVGKEFLTFSGGFEFGSFWEGQIIRTIDTSLAEARESGRILSWTNVAGLYHLEMQFALTLTPDSYVYFYIRDNSLVLSETLSPLDSLLTLKPISFQPHTSNFTVGQTSKTSSSWIFALTADPIDNTPFVKASSKLRTWTITNIDFADNMFSIRAKEYFTEKFAFIGEYYTRTEIEQLHIALPPVTNVDINVVVNQGFSAAKFDFEISYQHLVPIFIANSLIITYDIVLTMFNGETYRLRDPKGFSKRTNLDVALVTKVNQTHFSVISASVENFGTYFVTPTGSLPTADFDFTVTIKASVLELRNNIHPSPLVTYSETITLAKPERNFL